MPFSLSIRKYRKNTLKLNQPSIWVIFYKWLSECISLFTNENQLNNTHGIVSTATTNKNYIILYNENIWIYILFLSFFNIPYYSESHCRLTTRAICYLQYFFDEYFIVNTYEDFLFKKKYKINHSYYFGQSIIKTRLFSILYTSAHNIFTLILWQGNTFLFLKIKKIENCSK